MDQNLRDHFDRAVRDDPGAALDEMADAAIAEGDRLRRRRNHRLAAGVAAGVVVVIGTAAGVTMSLNPSSPAAPPQTIAAAMMPVTAPSCVQRPVEADATDAVIFLTDGLTDAQRSALGAALRDDPHVDAVTFESREQAYQKFRTLWADSPDFVDAVSPDQLPQSFRLRLSVPAQYTDFRARYATMAGVQDIIGYRCAKDAPVGGVL